MTTEEALAVEFIKTVMAATSMYTRTPIDGLRADWGDRGPDGKPRERNATVGEIIFDSLDLDAPNIEHEDIFAFVADRAKTGDDEALDLIGRMGRAWAHQHADRIAREDPDPEQSWARRQDEAQGVPQAWAQSAAIDSAMARILRAAL